MGIYGDGMDVVHTPLLTAPPGHLQRVVLREFTTPGWCLRAMGIHGPWQ